MKKLIVIGATTLAALGVALGVAPSANAYPETSCNVTVDAQKVESGTKLKVEGDSALVVTDSPRASVAGAQWRAEFNGVVRTATADHFTTTFPVPKVSTKTVLVLTVQAVMPDATTTCEKMLNITVLPSGTDVVPPDHHLPNTGGPRLALLFAGIGLVLAGGVAIQQARRRAVGVEA